MKQVVKTWVVGEDGVEEQESVPVHEKKGKNPLFGSGEGNRTKSQDTSTALENNTSDISIKCQFE